ncbi:hypothetical protein AAHE18_18G006600 [Arachis hypogaea]|uniref:Embryo-specific protein n=1 Tax=Arachis hypogaea TaxID=3818 RepID=A0A445CIM9_ARAHY|nr:embryo-specific protein ATS3A [Arachis hypogaea]XP_029143918.1 embryo-specific protein ATS3A isoform X1 [Arachis hypogaea]RYR50767.1 hypothetical protein Ahy_A07g037385 [Arachis hypogaea]
MNKKMKASVSSIVITFCIIGALSEAKPAGRVNASLLKHHRNRTRTQPQPQPQPQPNRRGGGGCIYSLTISTSCDSPTYTRDSISIRLRDADGNGVYVARLEDPSSGRFSRCRKDRVDLYGGPCIKQVCYVELYRDGVDGWIPETLTVSGYRALPMTFHFHNFIPRGVWAQINKCSPYNNNY